MLLKIYFSSHAAVNDLAHFNVVFKLTLTACRTPSSGARGSRGAADAGEVSNVACVWGWGLLFSRLPRWRLLLLLLCLLGFPVAVRVLDVVPRSISDNKTHLVALFAWRIQIMAQYIVLFNFVTYVLHLK